MTVKQPKTPLEELEVIEKKVVKEWKYLSKIKIKDENHLLFASFVLTVMCLLVVNTVYIVNKQPGVMVAPDVVKVSRKFATYVSSSQKIDNEAYAIAVSNVTASDTEDPAFPLSEGETILMAHVSITNKTNADKRLSPTQQMYVRSRDGSYFPFRVSTKTSNPLPIAEVKPDETIEGDITFAIPKSLGDPLVYFDLGWNNAVPSVYDIMK